MIDEQTSAGGAAADWEWVELVDLGRGFFYHLSRFLPTKNNQHFDGSSSFQFSQKSIVHIQSIPNGDASWQIAVIT